MGTGGIGGILAEAAFAGGATDVLSSSVKLTLLGCGGTGGVGIGFASAFAAGRAPLLSVIRATDPLALSLGTSVAGRAPLPLPES